MRMDVLDPDSMHPKHQGLCCEAVITPGNDMHVTTTTASLPTSRRLRVALDASAIPAAVRP